MARNKSSIHQKIQSKSRKSEFNGSIENDKKISKNHYLIKRLGAVFNNFFTFVWDLFLFTKKKNFINSADRIRQQRGRLYAKSILFISSAGVGIFLIIIALFVGLPQKLYQDFIQHCIIVSGKYGLDLKEVNIKGRKETSVKQLTSIVNAKLNTPILQYDLDHVRSALLAHPWIKKVSVHRRLPNVLHINIQERVPIALWQDKKKHYLVDTDGVVMNTPIPNHYKTLPIVAGTGAPIYTPKMLMLIEKFPNIAARTSGLIRIRERRWNITLDGSIIVKLPEDGIEVALARLAFLLDKNPLSKEHIVAVDLRNAEQIYIKMTEQASKILKLSSKNKTKI